MKNSPYRVHFSQAMNFMQPSFRTSLMGGTNVNGRDIKNNDPIQLHQRIIYYKAELAKYKYIAEKYEDTDHYSLTEKLEQENIQLKKEKEELSYEVGKLTSEIEKQIREYNERIYLHKIQKDTYMTTIKQLKKTKTDLLQMNSQLTEVINVLQARFNTENYRYENHDDQVSLFIKSLRNMRIKLLITYKKKINKYIPNSIIWS